jgi:hypothetical protein
MKDLDIFELFIDEEHELGGIEAISIVENPAIEEDFIMLKSQEVKLAEVDNEKRILMGAALIPNKHIYRRSGDKEYYIKFSEDTVRKASQLFLSRGKQNNSTLEHDENLNGLSVVESWIVEDEKQDKSRKYGLNVPVGTWMVSVKVNNDEVWEEFVKTEKVKGFSIEGFFTDKRNERPQESIEEEAELSAEQMAQLYEIEEIMAELNSIELATYNDYPESAVNNAKKVLKWKEEHGDEVKGMTRVGWTRASQLARKAKLSRSTIARMASFKRHQKNAEIDPKFKATPWKDRGYVAWLGWGGTSGVNWAIKKLEQIDSGRLAKVGPKGGIKKSPKAPKSETPNPNPKGKGTAKGDASGKTGAKVSAKDRATLQKKANDFNEKYKDKLGYGVTVGVLASVFQRGLGAFNTSHSPNVKSPSQWAFARVNAYLYLVKNGRPQNPKYTTDYDLLPKKHPKSSK